MMGFFVITATVDYDLGHHGYPRSSRRYETTWFHDEGYDSSPIRFSTKTGWQSLRPVKDVKIETTPKTKAFSPLRSTAPNGHADPKVLRGTTVSGDNY